MLCQMSLLRIFSGSCGQAAGRRRGENLFDRVLAECNGLPGYFFAYLKIKLINKDNLKI